MSTMDWASFFSSGLAYSFTFGQLSEKDFLAAFIMGDSTSDSLSAMSLLQSQGFERMR
jgi:hypothetical protein